MPVRIWIQQRSNEALNVPYNIPDPLSYYRVERISVPRNFTGSNKEERKVGSEKRIVFRLWNYEKSGQSAKDDFVIVKSW